MEISRESLLEHEYELETELPDWTGVPQKSASGTPEPAAPPPRRRVERDADVGELTPDEALARERTRARHARAIACLALGAATLAGIVALEQRAVIITRGGRIDDIRDRRCVDDSSGGVFASPAASYERLSHFVDAGLPGSVDKALDRWAIADGACRAAGASGASDVVLGADMYVIAALDALPATADGPSRFTRAALAELPPACARAADVAESGGAPFASFLPADVGASLYAWRRALCNASWPDPAYMPQQQALTLGFMCAAACGADGRVAPASALARLAASDASARASTEAACGALLAADGGEGAWAALVSWNDIATATAPLAREPCACTASGHR